MAEKYTSTLLPQDNTPQENQKAVLDLLKKTNQVHDDAVSGINEAKTELQKQIDANSGIRAYVTCRGNALTAANNPVLYVEVLDTANCFSAGIFTFPANGVACICASLVNGNASSVGNIYVGKNATAQYYSLQVVEAGYVGSGAAQVHGVLGDTIYINASCTAALAANTALGIQFTEIK